MTSFMKDTILIDEKLNIDIPEPEINSDMLHAVFLPYFMHPESLEIMVVLKREIMPGAYVRTGRKMGISAITLELPEDEPLTIEQVFEMLNKKLNTKLENAIPFGSVMPMPERSNAAYELVLAHVEPIEMIDENRGIIYQEKGKYEIGVAKFSDVVDGIQNGLIEDLKTRLILSELYVLALEESKNDQDPNQMMSGDPDMIGGGANQSPDFNSDDKDTMSTGSIPDDVIKNNSQIDYGSIYSKASAKGGDFQTAANKD